MERSEKFYPSIKYKYLFKMEKLENIKKKKKKKKGIG